MNLRGVRTRDEPEINAPARAMSGPTPFVVRRAARRSPRARQERVTDRTRQVERRG